MAPTANAPPIAPKAALMAKTPCVHYIKANAINFLGK
jgi:hypothetical protein